MDEQLRLDGPAVPYPLPRPRHLTERQRDLLRYVAIVYDAGQSFPTGMAHRFFVDASGALRRLEALGRVSQVGRGKWRAT
jgi:predicted RNA polymerase sigma factor